MRIAFLGSGAFGLPTLQSLATNHTLVGVVSQPDKPAGRGMALSPTPIAAWAAKYLPGVALLKPVDINEPSVLEHVRSWPVEAWVIIAFGQKLSKALIADRFAINLHASLLPRWRGAAPINAAILAGDTVTGNSVITIAERMDAGLVLGQSRRPIDAHVTAGELHDLLSADGPALVEQVLADHAAGRTRTATQVEVEVTKARKLSRANAWIDFTKPADQARCRVHGLTPWPGITARIGDRDVKLLRVASLQHLGTHAPTPPRHPDRSHPRAHRLRVIHRAQTARSATRRRPPDALGRFHAWRRAYLVDRNTSPSWYSAMPVTRSTICRVPHSESLRGVFFVRESRPGGAAC